MTADDAPGSTAYERYLRIGELLSLQRDVEVRVDADEMIFIGVQQSSELWLKLVAHDTGSRRTRHARARLPRRSACWPECAPTWPTSPGN